MTRLICIFLLFFACSENDDGSSNTDTSVETDTVTDVDTNTNTGTTVDTDTDTVTDVDTNTNTGTDTDVDTNTNMDTDTGTDTNTGTDADADTDTDTDTDTDVDTDTDTDQCPWDCEPDAGYGSCDPDFVWDPELENKPDSIHNWKYSCLEGDVCCQPLGVEGGISDYCNDFSDTHCSGDCFGNEQHLDRYCNGADFRCCYD